MGTKKIGEKEGVIFRYSFLLDLLRPSGYFGWVAPLPKPTSASPDPSKVRFFIRIPDFFWRALSQAAVPSSFIIKYFPPIKNRESFFNVLKLHRFQQLLFQNAVVGFDKAVFLRSGHVDELLFYRPAL